MHRLSTKPSWELFQCLYSNSHKPSLVYNYPLMHVMPQSVHWRLIPTNKNSDSSDFMPTLLNNNSSNSSALLLTLPTSRTKNSSDSSVPLPIQPTSNNSDSLARLITEENITPVSQTSPVRDLPSFHPVAKPTFVWGKLVHFRRVYRFIR